MWQPLALKAGNQIIPLDNIEGIDIASIEHEEATIITKSGGRLTALGFDAIEAVMIFKPSALEGCRPKWHKRGPSTTWSATLSCNCWRGCACIVWRSSCTM